MPASSRACRSQATSSSPSSLCGVLAAIAGILDFSFIQTSQPNIGLSFTFPVFAAVIIGGASLTGGKGTVIGTHGRRAAAGRAAAGPGAASPGPHVQQLFLGAVTIGAVALDLVLTQAAQRARGMSAAAATAASAIRGVDEALRQHDRARRRRSRHRGRRGARHCRTQRRRQDRRWSASSPAKSGRRRRR